MAEITLVKAVNDALANEMERDPSVCVLGEDIGRDGGVFRATEGLLRRFGPGRVIDTPLGMPPSASTTSGSNLGRRGQNAARPNAKRIAGSSVSADSIAKMMPIEATGPSVLFDFSSLSNRQRSPAITVPPDAKIGSNEPFSAAIVATHLSRFTLSSSRYRETYSSE